MNISKETKCEMDGADNCSNYSEMSHVSVKPDLPKVEEEPPIRVRDMINLYNFATEKNHELARAKSLYYGSSMKIDQGCGCDEICQTGGRLVNDKSGMFRLTTMEDQTSLHQSMPTSSAGGEAVEKSYQSKTTIRRTDQGVRIIIDIFFDKDVHDIDIVGSRVETDIPESRILADFQKQSLALDSQQMNRTPNV